MPPSDDINPPSKRATIGLPCTGDRPGSMGVASAVAGMALRDLTGLASTPKSYIKSSACAVPVNLGE